MMNFTKIIRDQRGSAMTEFVFFLPIWIVIFIGIYNLGQIGITATTVELQAQKSLWDQVIPLTDNSDPTHITPIGAGIAEQSNIPDLAVDANPQQAVDAAELALHGLALEVGGHWGESYERTIVFSAIVDDLDDLTLTPSDILGDGGDRPFPHLLLNDSVQRDWGNIDSVEGIVTNFISGSGIVPAMLAGHRYGVVFAEASKSETLILANYSVPSAAHFDTLVPPSPIRTAAGTDWGTFGGAFLLAQTIEQPYRVMQRFGKSEWEDFNSEDPPGDYFPDTGGELEEALEECQEEYDDAMEECDDEEDDLEDGETLSQECQDLRSNGNPCQGP